MDILSCKTPGLVRKEIYTYLLAYNLLRTIMYRAGTRFNRNYMRLSLQASRQHLKNLLPKLENKTKARRQKLDKIMSEKVADSYTKKRSKRVEPRVKKRRPLGCFLFLIREPFYTLNLFAKRHNFLKKGSLIKNIFFSFAYPLMQEPRHVLRAKLLSA